MHEFSIKKYKLFIIFISLNTMDSLRKLKRHLRKGKVYRRSDLEMWSNAVDRHLKSLIDEGTFQKLAHGLYYYPKETVFGEVPPDESTLVRAFLKDDEFLIVSPNSYNALGVGTTQLYNKRIVYNHKRHGEFNLGGRRFYFQMKPKFPAKVSPEFLLVDLINNLDLLAEDKEAVLYKAKEKAKQLDSTKLKRVISKYGGVRAKKNLSTVFDPKHG